VVKRGSPAALKRRNWQKGEKERKREKERFIPVLREREVYSGNSPMVERGLSRNNGEYP